jgi:tetratricopeptide (TPR) repeat protein
MQKLTINILIKNNFDEKKLLSLKKIKHPIQIGCKTLTSEQSKFCLLNNIQILKLKTDDYHEQKNELIENTKTGWILFLELWENIIVGSELLDDLQEVKAYHVQILNNKEIITKEIRIFHKKLGLKFKNPVHEFIESKSEFLNIIIGNDHEQDVSERMIKWEEQNKLNPVIFYYKSLASLKKMNILDFKRHAERYFFLETNKIKPAYIMLKYYHALILFYNDKNYNLSTKLVLECLCINPLMAEFWCLLGDIYYDINEFNKSIAFYKNAMLFGEERFQGDLWPLHIEKYKKYPNKMIDASETAKENIKDCFVKRNPIR